MITEKMKASISLLNSKFVYETDSKIDTWRFLKIGTDDKVYGDCDDYAATLAFELSDRSHIKFWWNYFTMRFVFWRVKTQNGNAHVILKYKGMYADNIYPIWNNELKFRRNFPMILIYAPLKLALGKLLRK